MELCKVGQIVQDVYGYRYKVLNINDKGLPTKLLGWHGGVESPGSVGREFNMASGFNPISWTLINEAKEAEMTFEEKVMDYIRRPERSQPASKFIALLNGKGFWNSGKSEDDQKAIVEQILESDVCEEGAKNFRDFVGLPKQLKRNTVRVVLDLEVDQEIWGDGPGADNGIVWDLCDSVLPNTKVGKYTITNASYKQYMVKPEQDRPNGSFFDRATGNPITKD